MPALVAAYALPPCAGDERTIIDRLILPMVLEATRVLDEGIVRDGCDVDLAVIHALGFPPFRGGPFRFLDALGAATAVAQLEALNARYPGRYEPAALLRAKAASGARFHP